MKTKESIGPHETLDDLILSGYKLYQRDDQFKFSMDAVMLAHFVPLKARASYVELGTGTAVIPHILVHRGVKQVVAIEQNEVMVDLARRSTVHNGLTDRIHIVKGDFREAATQLIAREALEELQHRGREANGGTTAPTAQAGKSASSSPGDGVSLQPPTAQARGGNPGPAAQAREFALSSPGDGVPLQPPHKRFDMALMNPPYFASGTGKTSTLAGVREALHEGDASLDAYIKAAKSLLTDAGYLYLIHRSDRLEDIVRVLGNHHFAIKRLRFVHGTSKKASKLVLIEAKGGAKTGMIVEAPLIMYDPQGHYTEEVKSWYE